MHVHLPLDRITKLTQEDVRAMDANDLLHAIWTAEEAYKGQRVDPTHDHRRNLDRGELERVFYMVKTVLERRQKVTGLASSN